MIEGSNVDSSLISCSFCGQSATVVDGAWVHVDATEDTECPGPDAWPRPVLADGPGSKPFLLGRGTSVVEHPVPPQGDKP